MDSALSLPWRDDWVAMGRHQRALTSPANSFPNPFNILYARNVAHLPRVLRCSIESGLT